MTFEQLECFVTVIKCGSYRHAAELLGVDGTTTKRSVTALENSLNTLLLSRAANTVTPTVAGEILYREAQELLNMAGFMRRAVMEADYNSVSKLNVAVTDFEPDALKAYYHNYCHRYPDVVFDYTVLNYAEVFRWVDVGVADVGTGFSFAMPHDLSDFGSLRIDTGEFRAVSSKHIPLSAWTSVGVNELKHFQLLYLQPESIPSKWIPDLFEAVGGDSSISMPSLESLMLKLHASSAYTLLPQHVAQKYAKDCNLYRIDDCNTSYEVLVIWRKDNSNPELGGFISALKSHIKSWS